MLKNINLFFAKLIATLNFFLGKYTGFFIPGTGYFLRNISEKFTFSWNGFLLVFEPKMASVYGFLIIGKSNEVDTLNYLNQLAKEIEDYTFINVGTCIGEFIFTDIGSNSNLIIGLDANINAIESLTENCNLNGLKNIKLFNNAVSDNSDSCIDFHLNLKNPNESSIINSPLSATVVHQVKAITIDSISNLIKGSKVVMLIDVEGAELKVLKGARETIVKYNPIIIFEYNYESRSIFSLEELVSHLPKNYTLFSLPDDKPISDFHEIYWNLIAKPS
jgi:FkbM family methyltransferase